MLAPLLPALCLFASLPALCFLVLPSLCPRLALVLPSLPSPCPRPALVLPSSPSPPTPSSRGESTGGCVCLPVPCPSLLSACPRPALVSLLSSPSSRGESTEPEGRGPMAEGAGSGEQGSEARGQRPEHRAGGVFCSSSALVLALVPALVSLSSSSSLLPPPARNRAGGVLCSHGQRTKFLMNFLNTCFWTRVGQRDAIANGYSTRQCVQGGGRLFRRRVRSQRPRNG